MNSGTSSPSSPGSELPSTGSSPPRLRREEDDPHTDSGVAFDPGDLGRQRRVDALDVAEQALRVGAQRVAHLAEVRHDLETFGTDAVRGGAGVFEQAASPLLGRGEARIRGLARLPNDLRGAVLGPRHDSQRLAGRGGRCRLRRRVRFRTQARCLGLRQLHSLGRLLLAGAHPIVGRPLRLRDTRLHSFLGLEAHALGGLLGGGDDSGDPLGGERRAGARMPACAPGRTLARAGSGVLSHARMVERRRESPA